MINSKVLVTSRNPKQWQSSTFLTNQASSIKCLCLKDFYVPLFYLAHNSQSKFQPIHCQFNKLYLPLCTQVEHRVKRCVRSFPPEAPRAWPIKAQLRRGTLLLAQLAVFPLFFFPNQQKIPKIIYTIGKCLYICNFLPKIKVGRLRPWLKYTHHEPSQTEALISATTSRGQM